MLLINTKSFQLATNIKGDRNAKQLALVLPGKLDTKDYPHMKSHVEYLADKGFLALSFDPPGTWESPGNIRLYTMTNYVKAVNELIEYFGNRPTFVMGHSRGGSIAMLAGTTNSSITRLASIMSYYTFKPEIHGEYPDEIWKAKGYKLSKRDLPENPDAFREFKLPYGFLQDQIQYDMLDGLRESSKPKLFVFGEGDTTVKPAIVKTAYAEAAEPKLLKSLNSDHDYRFHPKLIEQVNNYVGEFLSNVK